MRKLHRIPRTARRFITKDISFAAMFITVCPPVLSHGKNDNNLPPQKKACIRQGCEKSCKRKISYKTKYRCLGWRDSNPCRPSVPLFGTFRPFRLDLRQQACTSKNENCSKIVYCRVQSSFAWADFCSGKAKPAANTWCICKGFNAAWAKISRSKPTRVQVPSA